jgi:predicted NUDIX family phosphoesterase
MSQQITPTPVAPVVQDEQILVVKTARLFPFGAWHGIHAADFEGYIKLITQSREFMPRAQMEQDTNYKQIIPYLVFTHGDRYFLMQRTAKSTEQRLQSKYSLGIGGHMREEDMTGTSIFDWAQREFHEEVSYEGNFTFEPLGLLNDDSNAVGQVHLGLVLLLKGDSSTISVKSELKSGVLLSLEELKDFRPHMESWSQFVFDALLKRI